MEPSFIDIYDLSDSAGDISTTLENGACMWVKALHCNRADNARKCMFGVRLAFTDRLGYRKWFMLHLIYVECDLINEGD
jgi:hypothetical protein